MLPGSEKIAKLLSGGDTAIFVESGTNDTVKGGQVCRGWIMELAWDPSDLVHGGSCHYLWRHWEGPGI